MSRLWLLLCFVFGNYALVNLVFGNFAFGCCVFGNLVFGHYADFGIRQFCLWLFGLWQFGLWPLCRGNRRTKRDFGHYAVVLNVLKGTLPSFATVDPGAAAPPPAPPWAVERLIFSTKEN